MPSQSASPPSCRKASNPKRPFAKSSAPAGNSTLDWPCTARARGDHRWSEIHLETPSPLGLWHARDRDPVDCTLRVYPNLRDRATAALFLRTADPGVRLRRQVGKGREFENLRHYMPGDSIEDVDWKATARRAFPVVKLYRVEHAQEVYAVIDASRLSAREGILEGYVGAALHLALTAERQGDRFGLVTFSDRTHSFVRARSGMDHFRACRETIYNLQARRVSPAFGEVFTSLQLHLRRRSLVVFFTSLDDALLAETFEREVGLVSRRHLVLVNVTQTAAMKPLFTGEPPADLDALYSGLGGQMLWNRMRTLAHRAAESRRQAQHRRSAPHQAAGGGGVHGRQAEAGIVIVDLPRFVRAEKPYWDELEAALRKMEDEPELRMPLAEVERLHYLYERSSARHSRVSARSPRSRKCAGPWNRWSPARTARFMKPARRFPSAGRTCVFAFPRAFRRHWRRSHRRRHHVAGLPVRSCGGSPEPAQQGRADAVSGSDGLACRACRQ